MMGIIKKNIIRFLGSKSMKIHAAFGEGVVQTTKEIHESHKSSIDRATTNLIVSWSVSLPWAIFEDLFVNDNSWNRPLTRILESAEVINGEDCFMVSQSYCLFWLLDNILVVEKNRNLFSAAKIEQFINKELTKGNKIINKRNNLYNKTRNLPIDHWHYSYVKEIINALYRNEKNINALMSAVERDSQLRLALMYYFNEVLKRMKDADFDSGNVS
jgi:hypothetical protein